MICWEDDQYDPDYWEDEFFLDGDQELNFSTTTRDESTEPEDECAPFYL